MKTIYIPRFGTDLLLNEDFSFAEPNHKNYPAYNDREIASLILSRPELKIEAEKELNKKLLQLANVPVVVNNKSNRFSFLNKAIKFLTFKPQNIWK